jgi:predicted P-loop ATPase
VTISRFSALMSTAARVDDINWPDLFKEFSRVTPYRGDRQHPGWSAAEFDPPERALANVKLVHALVLDYDNTKGGDPVENPITIEQATEMFADYMGIIHTTRSHTIDWPRFRVILPLTTPLDRLAYASLWQAAERRWPGLDPAPKDPSRFWYTPGIPEDGVFEAVLLTGAWLNAHEFVENAPAQIVTLPSEHPSDPALIEKRARAYIATMPPAISGANGHAATFAVARKLVCDFGLDEQAALRILQSDYNPRCQPPWADKDLRHKVKQAVTRGKVRNPIQDRPRELAPVTNLAEYRATHETKVVPTDEWRKRLHHNQGGAITKDVGNVALILKNAPGFHKALTFDTMAHRIYWSDEPSYDTGLEPPHEGESLADHHTVYVQHVLLNYFGLSVGDAIVWKAMEKAAHENPTHPLQNYLDGLQWDGVKRLDKWLHTYMGCEDTEYNRNVGRWWMISAIARGYRPGCQADYVLILEGKQGKGKSQAIKTLGGSWVLDQLPDIRDAKSAAEVISGKWIVEIAELDALKGAGMTRIKSFATQQFDEYRPAYAKAKVKQLRSCVFIGTTNEHAYLDDPTGARRFWPVKVINAIDRAQLATDRDQLWAEAKFAFDNDEKWYPEDEKQIELIELEQADRYMEDDWGVIIKRWIRARGADDGFTSEDILGTVLSIPPERWDKSTQTRVGGILTKLGYSKKRISINGERTALYFPAL